MRERMDLMMNALRDKNPATSMTWSIEPIQLSPRLSIPSPSVEVSNATSGKLRRKQGPFGSFGVFQDLDAPLGDTRRDHVQSFSYHVERTCKDLVQQTDAQLY